MRFHIKTYGCQMNERDAETASALLTSRGMEAAACEADADVIIVNTCSVRGKAEDKALGKLGLMVAGKRTAPHRRVGVIGCMVQRLGPSIFDAVPGLDFALGTHRLSRLPEALETVLEGRGPVLEIGEGDEAPEQQPAGHGAGRVSAFVNILQGCDRRCAYCVVPQVRGPEQSRPAGEILKEVGGLAANGVKEVTLLGQSVMSYGRRQAVWPDASVSPTGFTEPLPRLLEAVSRIPGIARVRFTSGHPSGCTAELVRAMAKLQPVCEHLHMPLQSGSDRILEKMRRGYTSDGYRRAAQALRAAMPGMGLTSDVIVGFPSETIEDFEVTRAFCEEIGFDNVFVFKYSPRPATPAAEWEDDVSAHEKMRRNKLLLEDQDRRGQEINGRLVGRVEEVLVEGPSLRNAARWSGRTRANKIVVFKPARGMAAGDLASVMIERCMPQTLYGTVSEPGDGREELR